MERKTKESKDMINSSSLILNNCLYNCTECSSNLEILSLDENYIKFICNNNHNIYIKIEEYISKMKQYNNIKLNEDKCDKHKKKFLSYCFDCKYHLCEDCLIQGEHIYHYKLYILEILPKNEVLDKIRNLIKDNKIRINLLKKEKIKKENKLNSILDKNIKIIKRIINKNKINNKIKEKEELELINNKYKSDIEKLKNEYENKIKEIKIKYNNNINVIRNKYKMKNNKNEFIYNNKINVLNKKIELIKKENKYDAKMEQKINYNEIIELIYNTYINYNNNYYNSLNINNIYKIHNNIKINNIKNKNQVIEEKNKLIEDKDKLIKKLHNELDQYRINLRDNNPNSIRIKYKKELYGNQIQIFGDEFVSNNKDKCKIFYNSKEYDLTSKFNVENINHLGILEIQLNGILNITNMSYMFSKC